jgi:putative Holliday junction resolvase
MSAPERVLGLDVGSRTIGVSVTDELGVCAHSVRTIERKGTKKDVETIAELVKTYGARRVVVGMPYEIDGSMGRRAERVKVLTDALAAGVPGLSIDLWDERMSTVEAESVLIEADVSRSRRKAVIDKMAAQVILQSWLDSRTR